jgi:hypothetical protein
MAIFALHPTWGEFPYVLFSTTMTNWASSIAAGDTDFAKPCAYRAWLVTWRGFTNIYSSTTIAISTTPVDQINHLKPPALSYYNFGSSCFLFIGLLSALYHLLSQRNLRGDIGLARLKAFCKLTSIEPTEVGESSSGVHGEFTEGSLR